MNGRCLKCEEKGPIASLLVPLAPETMEVTERIPQSMPFCPTCTLEIATLMLQHGKNPKS